MKEMTIVKATSYRALLIALPLLACWPMNATGAVGRTLGSHAVSPAGAATYQIPLWVAPGAGGVQPTLSLTYNSRGGNGLVGPGWALAGLSSITRCNKTFAQDPTPGAVTLTYADAFCLDGRRLRLTSGGGLSTYGQAGTTYETEIASFTRVTAFGASGNGPQSFEARTKDGLIYEFGNTADSRITPGASVPTPYMWFVNKVSDRFGNSYVVSYGTGAAGSSGVGVPVSISYSPVSAGASTYINSVTFEYGPRAGQVSGTTDAAIVGYVNGTQVVNTNLLLAVKVYSNSLLVRRYVTAYEAAPATTRARLASITECAGNAASDCLAPTVVTYHNGASGVGATSLFAAANQRVIGRKDINGDGEEDVILQDVSDGSVRVAFATALGSFDMVTVRAGFTFDAAAADFTGSGVYDIVVVESQGGPFVRYTLQYDQSRPVFIAAPLSLPTGNYNAAIRIADSTGDGRDDLLFDYEVEKNGGWSTSLYASNSTNGTVTFAAPIPFSSGHTDSISTPNERLDFDGDGRQDFLREGVASFNPFKRFISIGLSRTTYVESGAGTKELSGLGYVVGYARINDDACTDIVAAASIYLSPCNAQESITVALPGTALAAMDWNSDGRIDVLVQNGSTFGVLLATGAGLAPVMATSIPVSTQNPRNVFVLDSSGDGQHDLGTWDASGFRVYRHLISGLLPDLVASITDGYGVSVSFTYVSNALRTDMALTDAPPAYSYPERNYRGPLFLVSSVMATSGAADGSTYEQQFSYAGARKDVTGRGFLGFSHIRIQDRRNSMVRALYMRTAFPFTGMVYRDDVLRGIGGLPVSRATFGHGADELDSSASNRRVSVYMNAASNTVYEVGGALNGMAVKTTAQTATFDAFGNATNIVTTVTDSQPGSEQFGQQWTSTVAHTINPDISNWCLDLPTQTTVTNTAPGTASLARTTSFAIDPVTCRVTQQTLQPGDPRWQVATTFGFDAFGNVDAVTVSPIGQPARTSTIAWATYAGRFPDAVTQAVTSSLSQTTSLGWDASIGVRTSVTDSNGLQTLWTYDSFGRMTRETHPDGTGSVYSLTACNSSNAYCGSSSLRSSVLTTLRDPSDSVLRSDYQYFDLFDRPQKALEQLLGSGYSETTRTYDIFGRLSAESFPHAAGEAYSSATYTYDLIGRVTRARRPISASNSTNHDTLFAYQGLSRFQLDALNRPTTQRYNAVSLVTQVTDAAGSDTDYEYDAFGRLLKTRDVLGNETVLTYNVRGMKMSTSDPDMGNWSYDYFASGELKSQTDAKAQTTAFAYDYLSRPLTRGEPEGTTTWTWGTSAASRNVGQLVSVAGPGYSESYTYDSVGRLSNRRIVSDTTYNYDYTYESATGALSTLQYPTSTSGYRLRLRYAYQNALLYQVKDADASTVFWQANSVNPLGQVVQETLGNGVVTNRSFDLVTGALNSIQSGVGGGATLQNESYLFDKIGNLIQRQHNQLGLTENFYYDALYRLDYSTLGGTTNLDLSYDAIGNITSRSDVAGGAAWTYHSTKKHAVVQAGSNTYSYDANGNAQTRNGQGITWTSYNYPTVINGPGKTLTFSYGPDRQRYRQVYTNGSITETTIYIGGALEKVTENGITDWRHSVFANGSAVAMVSRQSNGTNTTRYLLHDHQGSIAKILEANGDTFVSESFAAFGARRDASTWSGPCPCPDLQRIKSATRDGYTGHEMIGGQSMGLIHMNGRVYDSTLGRFLSADPFVQAPFSSQSLNRYSYVFNNPLSYTDPSGFSPDDYPLPPADPIGPILGGGGPSWGLWFPPGWQLPDWIFGYNPNDPSTWPPGHPGRPADPAPTDPTPAPAPEPALPTDAPTTWGGQPIPAGVVAPASGSTAAEQFAGLGYVDPSGGISDGQILHMLLTGYFEVPAYSDLGVRVLPDKVTISDLQNGDQALWVRVRDRMIAQVVVDLSLAVMGPVGSLEERAVISGGGGGGNLTRVGRWMSMQEFDQMSATGKVIEGAGGRTYVIRPPNPASYSSARLGSAYVEFDVPASVLRPASKPDWAVIPGPNVTTRIYGPPPLEMPKATCIVCVKKR
jgi:RHS repeat-associated protein